MSNSLTTYSSFSSPTSVNRSTHRVFKGFSTVDTDRTGETHLFDIDLINRDLLNAFYTRVGERVMRPKDGCKIWDWLMEPLTPLLHDQIVTEVVRICESDSRLVNINTQVFEYENGIRVEMTLEYRPFDVVNSFTLNFENKQQSIFSGASYS